MIEFLNSNEQYFKSKFLLKIYFNINMMMNKINLMMRFEMSFFSEILFETNFAIVFSISCSMISEKLMLSK